MKKISIKQLIISALPILGLNSSYGEIPIPMLLERCSQNSLDIGQAHGRNKWAIKCAENFTNQDSEFVENVNFFDRKARPKYPLVSNQELTRYDAPTDPASSCAIFTKLHGYCTASCFTPEQRVLFHDGYTKIKDATNERKNGLVALTQSSSLSKLLFGVFNVEAYFETFRDAYEKIREIKTSSGALRVTLNHPLLLDTGIMVQASDLKVGNKLVRVNGSSDEILSINDSDYFGRVYNIAPDSINPLENIIVAEGFLSGSANYQFHEDFKDLKYRQILRELIDVN